MSRLIIVGGGITGLAAAHRALKTLNPADITLLESDTRLGGKVTTHRQDGFVIEGGPDTFLSYKPRGLGLCRELGLEDRLHGTNPVIRRTYVMRGGRMYQLPEGLTGLIPSRFGPMVKTGLISPLGKLRMGLDFLIPARPGSDDESLADFVRRRLGSEVYERLIEPLMSGIYAGDGEALSLAATFPQLRQTEQEHGGLIKGMLAAKSGSPAARPGAKRWPAFLTPTTGLAEIVEALEARLGQVDLRLGARATALEAGPEGYRLSLAGGATLTSQAIIITTPAYAAADLLDGFDSSAAADLRGIPYVSTATVSVAYPLTDIPRPLDGYGYIIPSAERQPILACTWTSTKFPHRAPAGYGLIRAFIGRAGQSDFVEQPDAVLLGLVRDELKRSLGITAAPMLQRVFRWPQAMPQYTLGHLDRVAVIRERSAAHPGLYLAGAAYHGVGLPDCIASGEAAADGAAAFLKTQPELMTA